MTTDRARDILNAASLGRGTGHVYTGDEAAALLALATRLAGIRPAEPAAPAARAADPAPLRLVILGRAA